RDRDPLVHRHRLEARLRTLRLVSHRRRLRGPGLAGTRRLSARSSERALGRVCAWFTAAAPVLAEQANRLRESPDAGVEAAFGLPHEVRARRRGEHLPRRVSYRPAAKGSSSICASWQRTISLTARAEFVRSNRRMGLPFQVTTIACSVMNSLMKSAWSTVTASPGMSLRQIPV